MTQPTLDLAFDISSHCCLTTSVRAHLIRATQLTLSWPVLYYHQDCFWRSVCLELFGSHRFFSMAKFHLDYSKVAVHSHSLSLELLTLSLLASARDVEQLLPLSTRRVAHWDCHTRSTYAPELCNSRRPSTMLHRFHQSILIVSGVVREPAFRPRSSSLN